MPRLAAIFLKKGSMTLEVADLSASRLRPVIADIGLSGDMTGVGSGPSITSLAGHCSRHASL